MSSFFSHIPKNTRLHFIGVGGIGMSGIAELFLQEGYCVSGSDLKKSDSITSLLSKGLIFTEGHFEKSITEPTSPIHVVISSSAITESNPEIQAARRLKIPILQRAELLGELMKGKRGISIAGTHGKTTTTSLVSTLFQSAGLDPTCVIGGKVDALGGNSKKGLGDLMIVEADESDASFLHLPSVFVVVTNIDDDHLDFYKDSSKIDHAFKSFIQKIPFYGKAILCGDNERLYKLSREITKPHVTYGFDKRNDFQCKVLHTDENLTRFEILEQNRSRGLFEVGLFGNHNVLNSTSAAILGFLTGLNTEQIQVGLRNFKGVRRRFETKWSHLGSKVIDDYGHHPTEIKATLQAARQSFKGKIHLVFEPHRYTRTKDCYSQYLTCFEGADELWLCDIYSANEPLIEGINSKKLASDIQTPCQYVGSLDHAFEKLCQTPTENTLFLMMGAGAITQLSTRFASWLREHKK